MKPGRILPSILSLAAAALLAGCVSGSKIRADAEVVKRDIAKARESGAYRCAPKDLAMAESNVEFTMDELDQGQWLRAKDHVDVALAAVARAIENSVDCAPKKVLIKQPKVVAITKSDRDGDGIPDIDDKCPDTPGLPEYQGCPPPKPSDSDGDGILDNVDKCPNDPEDKDGFQDEDGCPDFDNDQDGIPDVEDKCPNEPGPPETQGCPVKDRDKDGIYDDVDKCPDEPEDKDGFQDEDGCPDLDNDQDGIPDATDKCPNEPEDKDEFQDEDGCPDPDNDGDGIADVEDKCPNEPGPPDSPQGKGCPRKYKLVKINREKKRIEIKQKVYFQTAKWKILSRSYGLLRDVAQVLKDFPKMRVSVEGHTDSQGSDSYNQGLSERRANAVREFLINQDIAPDRLRAIGFGESKPIASNRTARGREANRRVEFRIMEENE
ncbi:MAG: OmpA family protein [Deltaproteobacteria bacterium]|nr:OmpA family protein [Deltaproteobacteria bacterium]